MAEYIHTQSGAHVSVSDDKELGEGFQPVEKPKRTQKDKSDK